MRLWEGAEVIPGRSAARAARAPQTVIGFANAIGGREVSSGAPLNTLSKLGLSLRSGLAYWALLCWAADVYAASRCFGG